MTALALRQPVDVAFLRRWLWLVLSLGGLVPLVWLVTTPGHGFDFYAYWSVNPAAPYAIGEGFGAFHYPPPFVWLFAPLRVLPFEVGYLLWTAANIGALVWLTGRWALAWLLFPPVTSELYHGNVHLLMAVLLVVGFREAAAWAPLAMAKVSSGVIVLWPLFRREWAVLGRLAVVCALICVPTLLLASGMWIEWAQHLLVRNAEAQRWGAEIGVPLGFRLAAAVALMAYGARTDRRWVTAPALALAMPVLWVHSLAVLAALPRLRAA